MKSISAIWKDSFFNNPIYNVAPFDTVARNKCSFLMNIGTFSGYENYGSPDSFSSSVSEMLWGQECEASCCLRTPHLLNCMALRWSLRLPALFTWLAPLPSPLLREFASSQWPSTIPISYSLMHSPQFITLPPFDSFYAENS